MMRLRRAWVMAAPRTTSFGFRFPSGVSVQNHARPEIERSSGIEIDGGSMLRTHAQCPTAAFRCSGLASYRFRKHRTSPAVGRDSRTSRSSQRSRQLW